MEEYIDINKIADLKGLKSNRSIRIAIQKGKYQAREVSVKGGTSYEILISSLEVEFQEALLMEKQACYSLVPLAPQKSFTAENARLKALARIDLLNALKNFETKYPTKKQAWGVFIEIYNSGEYMKQVFKTVGTISRGTIYSLLGQYDGTIESLIPKYKYAKFGEYNSKLTPEMIKVFLKMLLNPNKLQISKAIEYTRLILERQGVENIPSPSTFKRYANHFKKHNYDKWVLMREGEKALNDKVHPYIERDISKLEVGDIFVADGHRLNFQVINPFTGKPTRATLVGFFDWKSGALVGYEIMLEENTQCIASALRNAILNLGLIPKVVYQDNGRAFKAKFFQDTNFDEEGFNGVYQNLGIKSVFAKPYNAKAKIIERFFLEFQEGFEKLMPTYIGTSIQNKPPHLLRGEKFHKKLNEHMHKGKTLTIQDAIQFINSWLDYYNSKQCLNVPQMTIKQVLNSVEKQKIDISTLDNLMMKTEIKTLYRNGVKFLGMHFYNDELYGVREKVLIRYSLFDLTKINVYSTKGEFLCVAKRVTGTHPMAHHLGMVKDMEDLKRKIHKQMKLKKEAYNEVRMYLPGEDIPFLTVHEDDVFDYEDEPLPNNVVEFKPKKQTPRQIQMNKPFFNSDFEKYEWFKTHGCTNSEDRTWLENFLKSDEYQNIYGDE